MSMLRPSIFVAETDTSMSPPAGGSCPVSPMITRGGCVLLVRLITVAWPLNWMLADMFEQEELPEPQVLPAEPQEDFPDAPRTTTGAFFTGTPRPHPKSVAASVATMAIAVAILAA